MRDIVVVVPDGWHYKLSALKSVIVTVVVIIFLSTQLAVPVIGWVYLIDIVSNAVTTSTVGEISKSKNAPEEESFGVIRFLRETPVTAGTISV